MSQPRSWLKASCIIKRTAYAFHQTSQVQYWGSVAVLSSYAAPSRKVWGFLMIMINYWQRCIFFYLNIFVSINLWKSKISYIFQRQLLFTGSVSSINSPRSYSLLTRPSCVNREARKIKRTEDETPANSAVRDDCDWTNVKYPIM